MCFVVPGGLFVPAPWTVAVTRSRVLGACVLAVAALVAGCGTVDDDPEPVSVSVTVTNQAESPQEVRVAVVPGEFEAVDVTYDNGTTRRLLVTETAEIRAAALVDARNVTVVGDGVRRRAARFGPGEGASYLYGEAPANARVVYVVWPADADRVTTYGTLACDTTGTDLEASVTVRSDDDVSASVTCRE